MVALSISNSIYVLRSKYESGKAELEMRDVRVQDLVEQAIELAFKPSPAKDLDVRHLNVCSLLCDICLHCMSGASGHLPHFA